MKTLFLLLLSFNLSAQQSVDYNRVIGKFPSVVIAKGYYGVLLESTDTVTYEYSIQRRKKVWAKPPVIPPPPVVNNPVSKEGIDYTAGTNVRKDVNAGLISSAGGTAVYQIDVGPEKRNLAFHYAMEKAPDITITLRFGSLTATPIQIKHTPTGLWSTYVTSLPTTIPPVSGNQTVYMTFSRDFHLRSFTLSK